MRVKLVTPAEVKEVWESFDKPSIRKVAERFRAAGRPVHHNTVGRWKLAGWPGTSAADIATDAAAALAKMDRAAPALTGDVRSTTADLVEVGKAGPPDHGNLAEHAEDALREVITGAAAIWRCIRHAATAQPEKKKDATGACAPLTLLLATPDGIARLAATATDALNKSIAGARLLAVLHAENAAAVPGAQTVYPPGHGPHADGSHGKRDYPLRSAIEALEQALKDDEEENP